MNVNSLMPILGTQTEAEAQDRAIRTAFEAYENKPSWSGAEAATMRGYLELALELMPEGEKLTRRQFVALGQALAEAERTMEPNEARLRHNHKAHLGKGL